MATRNIGTLTVDVIAKIGGFEEGMSAAERRAQRLAGTLEKTTAAGAEGFRRMAEQSQTLARLSETTKTFLDPGDASSRWAKNAAAFEKAHEAAKKLVQDGERMQVWQQAFAQTESQDAFLRGLRATAEAAGKTRAQLLELQAARAGLNDAGRAEAQRLIAQIAATDKSFQSFNKTGRLTALELQQVGYQVQDFFVQVSSGQSVVTAFIQQGAQLQGTFGGIGNAFRAIASTITPFRLAVGGTIAALAGFGYAAKQVEDFTRSIGAMQAVLKATGRGEIFPGLKDTINQLALLPGVSRDIATQAVDALVRIPQLAGPIFDDLTKIVGDYARVTGKELPDAAKDLGQAFADPARGAEQLDKVLGNLSAETLITVKALTEQGRVVEAQAVLYDEVTRKIGGLAREGMTPLQNSATELGIAWEKLKGAFRDTGVFDAVNRAIARNVEGLARDVQDIERLIGKVTALRDSRKPEASFTAPAFTGGATGDFGLSSEEINKQAKALLGVSAGYASAAKKANDLADKQKSINAFIKEYGQSLPKNVLTELQDRVKGIQEAASKANKSNTVRDDAAERQLLSLREQEASLRAQLVAVEDLTTQQQELAKFEQQIADLKEKKVLTADQKILLQNEDQLRLQLQINAALSVGLKAKDDAAKAAKKEADELERQRQQAEKILSDYLAASEALQRNLTDRNRSRGEALTDLLAGTGAGRGARQQILEQIQLQREFDRERRAATERAAQAGLLGSALYREDLAKIDAAQREALAMQKAYWDELTRLQGDWRVGASEAMNNYLDEVADIASQVQDLFTGMFKGAEDALVQFVTTGKLNFKSLADSILADITRIIIRQQITGPLAQSITGAATGGGLLSDLLGALFGGTRAGGGPAYAGSAYLVGEEGPELFVPRMSGTVIPADKTATRWRGMNVQQSFFVSGATDQRTQQQIAAAAARGLATATARMN